MKLCSFFLVLVVVFFIRARPNVKNRNERLAKRTKRNALYSVNASVRSWAAGPTFNSGKSAAATRVNAIRYQLKLQPHKYKPCAPIEHHCTLCPHYAPTEHLCTDQWLREQRTEHRSKTAKQSHAIHMNNLRSLSMIVDCSIITLALLINSIKLRSMLP